MLDSLSPSIKQSLSQLWALDNRWRVEYDYDPGPNDEVLAEYWVLTDGYETLCQCFNADNALNLAAVLNALMET